MPIYEYTCRGCENAFERYVKAWGDAVVCDRCQGVDVEKRLSTFAMSVSGSSSGSSRAMSGGGCCGGGGCGCH